MVQELSREAIREDDNEPATKGELRSVARELRRELRQDMATMKNEILDHFDATVENIVEELKGAFGDELSLIREQKLPDHEQRIQTLEDRAGLPVGPRNA